MVADAASAADALRSYALAVADHPDAAPEDLGLLRRGWRLARDRARAAARGASAPLGTRDGWLRAFALAETRREALDDALAELPLDARERERLTSLLDDYDDWAIARFDPAVPAGLRDRVAREIVHGRVPKPDTVLREGALRARRIHPALPRIAPQLFASLLEPDLRMFEPRTRASGRRYATAPAGERNGSERWLGFVGVLLMIVLVRACRSTIMDREIPAPNRDHRRFLEDIDERMKRIREQRERQEHLREQFNPGGPDSEDR